jgi:hypothetical protein
LVLGIFIMVLSLLAVCRSLAASALLLASAAHAQTPAPSAPPLSYPSAFGGYKPYTDEPTGNWKAANETTARIGGWREYARQAQGLDTKLDNMPAAQPVQSTPSPAKVKP